VQVFERSPTLPFEEAAEVVRGGCVLDCVADVVRVLTHGIEQFQFAPGAHVEIDPGQQKSQAMIAARRGFALQLAKSIERFGRCRPAGHKRG